MSIELVVFDWNGTLSNARDVPVGNTIPPLYDGVLEVLAALDKQHCHMAIATGHSFAGLSRELKHYNIAHYFSSLQTADTGLGKPHPSVMDDILSDAGLEKSQVLMVGDTANDMRFAVNSGVKAVAVSYGAYPASGLNEYAPHAMIDDIRELLSVVNA